MLTRTPSKTPLELDIPAYFSYRTRPEYENEECPSFVTEDALRHWGNVFAGHPPIPGWTSDWTRFSLVKRWFLPSPLWSESESVYRKEFVGYRIRSRLRSVGEIIPILYHVNIHAWVILRVGERVVYCRSILPEEEFPDDDDTLTQIEILGILPISFSDFVSADSATILAHMYNRESQRNLNLRGAHACTLRKEYFSTVLAYALEEATDMGKVPDAKTFYEWTDGDWEELKERSFRAHFKYER